MTVERLTVTRVVLGAQPQAGGSVRDKLTSSSLCTQRVYSLLTSTSLLLARRAYPWIRRPRVLLTRAAHQLKSKPLTDLAAGVCSVSEQKQRRWASPSCHYWRATLRASLSGTFLQTLPYLVTPLKGHSLSPRSCPPTRSAPSERFGYWYDCGSSLAPKHARKHETHPPRVRKWVPSWFKGFRFYLSWRK